MKIYLVGGAVRDELLGIEPKDRDFVVIGSTHEEMIALGYECQGKAFPVYRKNKEEYALARKEVKISEGSRGFEFDTSESISLESDLFRRDLTINAIAQDMETGELTDPYNGMEDIKNRVLRHVSGAFSEDPLRVLRAARFAARYGVLGFTVAEETLRVMRDVVESGELETISKERIWQEIESALGTQSPHIFFQVLREIGALAIIMPEVDALFGIPQVEEHHPEICTGIHVMMALERSVNITDCKVARFGVLVHDLGKALTEPELLPRHIGHEERGVECVVSLCKRLRVPNEYLEFGKLTAKHHTKMHGIMDSKAQTIVDLIGYLDGLRRPNRVVGLAAVGYADSVGRLGFENKSYPQYQFFIDAYEIMKKAPKDKVNYKSKDVKDQIRTARIASLLNFCQPNKRNK
ncbi:multifunctional CCA addition/repair protein [Vibrio splendidus]|nr:multifunctional CCA addition/repair protein [Vibrio splendidus]MCC4880517.1 multifunctional CCA addition/repair protein [Vibrio splendidus]